MHAYSNNGYNTRHAWSIKLMTKLLERKNLGIVNTVFE